MKNQILEKVKDAIRNPYAWPGGYPVYVVMADGELLCRDCARKNYKEIVRHVNDNMNTDWEAAGAEILWEDFDNNNCCHCGIRLESAYGEPEAD